jgi:hypothetical protein
MNALKQKKYGDFDAVYRPFWNTGGEMGNWDEELMYENLAASFFFGGNPFFFCIS